MSDEIERLLRLVPQWSKSTIALSPLAGGITNRNFVALIDGGSYVVRLPGDSTELLGIDRARERVAAQRASDLGIGPSVVAVLPEVDTLITRFVDGEHLAPQRFAARLEGVVGLLHRFHRSGPIDGAFPIHRVVEWHARDAAAHGGTLPPAFERLHELSTRIEAAFAQAPLQPVPCHNDLLPANVVFGDAGTWLLDFEYAGMNDVFFDLANLSVNCGLGDDDQRRLLSLYFGQMHAVHWARLQLMTIMSEFREGMWGVVQQAISSLDTDFEGYARERLENCERLARTAPIERWLDEASQPTEKVAD